MIVATLLEADANHNFMLQVCFMYMYQEVRNTSGDVEHCGAEPEQAVQATIIQLALKLHHMHYQITAFRPCLQTMGRDDHSLLSVSTSPYLA